MTQKFELGALEKSTPERAYKVVRYEDGQAVSVYADYMGEEYPRLDYNIGSITTAPTGDGIFCFSIKETAEEDAVKDYGKVRGKTAVMEVLPLGAPIEGRGGKPGSVYYSSVIPLREVWREKPELKEEWVDVTKGCTLEFLRDGSSNRVGIRHGSHIRLLLGKKAAIISAAQGGEPSTNDKEDYKVELTDESGGWANLGSFKVLKKVNK